MENVGIFYGHLEYFTDIWNILRTFGIFYGHLVMFWQFGIFSPLFWYNVSRKIWQPWVESPYKSKSDAWRIILRSVNKSKHVGSRVARWYIYKPIIPIWVNGFAKEDVGIFYDICSILLPLSYIL
jgi:hypothetical protein